MSSKRVYLFGIGSPAWQRKTGHIVNELGVPIPVHKTKPPKRRRPKRRRR